MRKILENASEIYCTNSSIFCFIEQLETTSNLYHSNMRGHSKGQFKQWKSI